jgi:hypothetical protein
MIVIMKENPSKTQVKNKELRNTSSFLRFTRQRQANFLHTSYNISKHHYMQNWDNFFSMLKYICTIQSGF